ncbi:2-acyl-glycerophospho-ethanolamine acyltransferase [Aquisphaera giovannonii]|uniref:2-acyl-glycerophospho-ethanolamine acyltransferase n=1 Tax=Aquisphaera giovannonii TaxID=406548 RepID=A0A5B9WCM2_9BACT|nr:2-acyl-glycerophospho-ethanolamine acyltransferase [Aquisphaera giovannonii]
MARLALHLFFRRIEVEARHNAPPVGPVLFVPNHTNALVDPLVLMTSLRREVTITAKDLLGRNPLLRWLMAALGVVTFHRRSDVGKGADLRANVRSLQLCREILAGGGAICIFPEGVSHSDPGLRGFHAGPARIALDYLKKDGNPGRLRIVPVGLLYTEKDRFRSGVWLRFGHPIDVARWAQAHPLAGPAELTAELERQVRALTLNYESRRESAILSWTAEIAATRAEAPAALGGEDRPVADWFRLLGRLQAGYRELLRSDPRAARELARRIRRHRSELRRAGIAPHEVYLPMHPGRAAFFLVRELELAVVGTPLALFGAVNHIVPYQIVEWLARRLSTDRDHWASNVIYPGIVIFPASYAVLLAAAWWILPPAWAALYTVLLPFTGYYALLFRDRAGHAWRRTVTFLRFLRRPGDQARLAAEGRAIVDRLRELGGRLEREQAPPPEPGAGPLPRSGAGPLFALSASALEEQFRDDIATLRDVLAGLDRLQAEWAEARGTIRARDRGYFTPAEDDRVRRLLLAYRSYRMVLYEIVERYLDHDQLEVPADQVRGFLIAYAAGLTLYASAMKFIQAYEREPLIRKKLNEPDPRSGLGPGFFEEVFRTYTSLINYRTLAGCGRYWLAHRREARAPGLRDDPDWPWLVGVIRGQRARFRTTFWSILRLRARHDGRFLLRSLRGPIHRARYGLRAFVGATLGPRHTVLRYEPALDAEVLSRLAAGLEPGDVLLARSEHKFTTAILPGFWCHAALYLGRRGDLERLGLASDPAVRPHLDRLSKEGGPFGATIEAVAPRVAIRPLEECLRADHVLALRPDLPEADRRAAVIEAFRHLGEPYDFEFDFNVPGRMVCTELVYRSYHDRGPIAFPLTRRLGRYTLSCDDIVRWLLDRVDAAAAPEQAPFHPVCLVLQDSDRGAKFVPRDREIEALRLLRDGVAPSAVLRSAACSISPPPQRVP